MIDASTVIMVAAGCACLVLGGAVLRGSDKPALDLITRLRSRLAERNQEVAALESRVKEAEDAAANRLDAMEDLRVEMERALVQKQERISALQVESERLSRELAAEKTLGQQMETAADDLRKSLKAAQDDAKRPRAPSAPPTDVEAGRLRKELERVKKEAEDKRGELERELATAKRTLTELNGAYAALERELDERRREADKAKTVAPQAMDALSEARSDLESARRSIEHLTRERDDARHAAETLGVERDAARERIEAMERLVEGVRARSRELTDELARLRGR